MSHLIGVEELAELLHTPERVRVLDVRWRMDQPEGRPDYVRGHIPGAVYVDLEHDLSYRGHPEEGSHPLPAVDDLEEAARRWGVRAGDVVVAYDDNSSVPAARLWWLLGRAGVDVKVLDGGLRAWIRGGRLLEAGHVAVTRGDVVLARSDAGVLSIDDVGLIPEFGVLLDVRRQEHYRGLSSASDPVAGHIPGAVNLPATESIDERGRLKPPEELRRRFADVGAVRGARIALYCSSGVASAHSALALSEIGLRAEVYPGSWSQWSRHPSRPVAVGPTPSGTVFGS